MKVFQDLVQKVKQIGEDQVEQLVISTNISSPIITRLTFYLNGKLNLGA
jgi:hypothetical protein